MIGKVYPTFRHTQLSYSLAVGDFNSDDQYGIRSPDGGQAAARSTGPLPSRSSFCRPRGTRFLFLELTPDLGPGLSYAAPTGLGSDDEFCVFAQSLRVSGRERMRIPFMKAKGELRGAEARLDS